MSTVDVCQIDATCVGAVVERAVVDLATAFQRYSGVFVAGVQVDHTSCAKGAAIESAVADKQATELYRCFGSRNGARGVGGFSTHQEQAVVDRQGVDVRCRLFGVICADEVRRATAELTICRRHVVRRVAGHHTYGFAGTLNRNALDGEVRLHFEAAG